MSTKTITYMSMEMEMEADTTNEEIRSWVEQSSMYEYDREDMTTEQVDAHVEDVIAGLIRARDEAFAKTFDTSVIEETIGLRTTYGGGDYNVTVWAVPGDFDREDGYELIFTRSNTDLAHERQWVSAEDLETEMAKWQPDFEKWVQVEFDA